MTFNTALVILIVGALAGLAFKLAARSKTRAFSLPVHLIVGVIGAYHGRLLFQLVDITASGLVGHLLFAAVGAILFVYPLRFIKPS